MPHPTRPELREVDPITMRRRAMIAALLGITSASALPAWAEDASVTPDLDHTRSQGNWAETYIKAEWELDQLGARYVTQEGVLDRHRIMDSGLWLAAQTKLLAERAPLNRKADAHRLAAEACAFTAGCYIDFGNNKAATELYDRGYLLADGHHDLRAFILAQWNWVPMYSGQWHKVLKRADQVIRASETHGGYGLLMGYSHRAKACAVLGNQQGALDALDKAQDNIARVPGSNLPHHALRYSASKAHFSASTVYAELGLADQQRAAQDRATADKTLGYIDASLMKLGAAAMESDPEYAAHRMRFHMLTIPSKSFNHCVLAEGKRQTARLVKHPGAGPEVRMLDSYLRQVKVA